MELINFVKNEYWLDKAHGQQGLESSPGSIEYTGDRGAGCGVYWDELVATNQYKYWEFADVIGVIQI